MTPIECPPGYVLAQVPQEPDHVTCSCNFDNDLILQCDGRNILIEVDLLDPYMSLNGIIMVFVYGWVTDRLLGYVEWC